MKTIEEENLIDKIGWGDGPWQTEPDKRQWLDETTGLPCLIVRNPHLGNLCGYVGVAKGHPAYGQDYMGIDVDVHGGLSYASACDGGHICHKVEEGEDDNVYWLGFDCGHMMDVSPKMDVYYKSKGLLVAPPGNRSYKDFAYVTEQCAQLAAQLKAMT